MKLICPDCGKVIAAEDISMKEDLALCNECNEAYPIRQCRPDTNDFDHNILLDPPSGCSIENDYDGAVIHVSRRCLPFLLFLIPFTCIWGGGSLGGIYGSQIKKGVFELGPSLFGLPFLIGTIVLVSVCVYCMFGRVRIKVDGYQLHYFNGIPGIGFRKTIEVGRIKNIVIETSSGRTNGKVQKKLVLKGDFPNGKDEINLMTTTNYDRLEFARSALLSLKKR